MQADEGAKEHPICNGPIAPGVRWAGAVAGRTPSAPWMGLMGWGKAASPAAFPAGGAWPSPEPLPPCQPFSGWLLILDVVCRQRGLQPAPLLGPQREVGGAPKSVGTQQAAQRSGGLGYKDLRVQGLSAAARAA